MRQRTIAVNRLPKIATTVGALSTIVAVLISKVIGIAEYSRNFQLSEPRELIRTMSLPIAE